VQREGSCAPRRFLAETKNDEAADKRQKISADTMATNENNTSRPAKYTKKRQTTGIAIGLIVAVMVFAFGYQARESWGRDLTTEEVNASLEETERLRRELEVRYKVVEEEKQIMQEERDHLRKLVANQRETLTRREETIRTLMKDNRRLVRAKEEADQLKEQVGTYIAQISQLQARNKALGERDRMRTVSQDSLGEELAARQAVIAQQVRLLGEREQMNKILGLASVVKMKQVTATGQRIRSNGRVKQESEARHVDQLMVCFTTMDNEVVRAGQERFHIRVVNPVGETLAVEDMGSGFFTDRRSGAKVRFTREETMEYSNTQQEMCMVWAPANASFPTGDYRVEIYNKGHLAGTALLTLR
jgi:hypothetical protein